MQTAAVRYLVRPMNLGDIPQVMEVEQQSFPTTWPQTAFKRELQQNRLARYLVAVERGDRPETEETPNGQLHRSALGRFLGELKHILSPEEERATLHAQDELVVGFVGVWLLADEAHIVTVAVRESYRGRGIGELLLIAAIALAQENHQSTLSLECRVSNSVALSLYEKYGFQRVGLRPRYYSDNQEDAHILTASGLDSQAYRSTFLLLKEEHRQRWGDYKLQL